MFGLALDHKQYYDNIAGVQVELWQLEESNDARALLNLYCLSRRGNKGLARAMVAVAGVRSKNTVLSAQRSISRRTGAAT